MTRSNPHAAPTPVDTNAMRFHLEEIAQRKETLDYKTLAERLSITPPGMIRKTTTLLEACQEEDALLQQPQLAAVIIQKTGKPYPRPGFFQQCRRLGLYIGPDEGPDAQMWHQNELEKVYAKYAES